MNAVAASADKTFLGNIKVRTKILGSSGIILLALAAVGGMSFLSFTQVAGEFEEFSHAASLGKMGDELMTDFALLNADAKEFLLTEDAAALIKAEELAREMAGMVEEAKALARTEKEAAEIVAVGAKIGEVAVELKRIGVLSKEQTALVNDIIVPDGAKMKADLEEISKMSAREGNANALIIARTAEISLAQMQGALATVLGLDREHAAEAFEKSFHELGQAISGLDKATAGTDLRPVFEELAALAEEYHTAAEKAVEEHHELQEIIEVEMAKTSEAAEAELHALAEEISADEQRLHDELVSGIATTEIFIAVVALVGLVVSMAVAFLVASGITKPIVMMTGVMKALTDGDRTVHVPARGNRDEIGAMANSVQVFKENLLEVDRLRAEQEEAKQRAETERRQAMQALADSFESTVGGVVSAVSSATTELQATAQSLSATAEETSRQSTAVSAASEQTTQNVQTVAAATEELTSSIREINNQVNESSRIVGEAVAQANETSAKVKFLAEAAQRIGDVVTLINEIASQTNLLALNATIEAARAGESRQGLRRGRLGGQEPGHADR